MIIILLICHLLPETLRNDLYLTIVRGEFERGTKSAAKNVEVRVKVIDKHSKKLEVSSISMLKTFFILSPPCISLHII